MNAVYSDILFVDDGGDYPGVMYIDGPCVVIKGFKEKFTDVILSEDDIAFPIV